MKTHRYVALWMCTGVCLGADITGRWAARIPGEPRATPAVFAYKTQGEKLTGTLASTRGEIPLEGGKVQGDRISFREADSVNGVQTTRLFEAVIAGKEAKFTYGTPGETARKEFTATRLAEPLLATQAAGDFEPTADPESPAWKRSGVVSFETGRIGVPVPGHRLEVRATWTEKFLYLLFVCPYEELNLRPNPSRSTKTDGLWDWDVVELFISSRPDYLGHYREFELSPQGEWLDMAITRPNGPIVKDLSWNSGWRVEAKVDAKQHVWYGVMKIPIASFDSERPALGREYHLSLCRIQEPGPDLERKRVVWFPGDFHYPAQLLRLTK